MVLRISVDVFYSRWSHLWFPAGGLWWKSYHFMCSRLIHTAKLPLKLGAIISLPNAEQWNKSSHPRGLNVFCVTQLGCFKPVALWEWWISSLRSSYSWCLRLTHLAVMDVSISAWNMYVEEFWPWFIINQLMRTKSQAWKGEQKGPLSWVQYTLYGLIVSTVWTPPHMHTLGIDSYNTLTFTMKYHPFIICISSLISP